MARHKKDDDELGAFPEDEQPPEGEHGHERVDEIPTDRPQTLRVATQAGFEEISTDPEDLDQYEGEYKQLSNGEIFGLKEVPDDDHGRTHHLKNKNHFWAGTADEFRNQFEKQ
jgi:hypothetical protein